MNLQLFVSLLSGLTAGTNALAAAKAALPSPSQSQNVTLTKIENALTEAAAVIAGFASSVAQSL